MCSLLQVKKVHFDTQDHGPQTITGLEPKEVPLLHQQQGKGSVEWENSHYVSGPEWEGVGGPHQPPPPAEAGPVITLSGTYGTWAPVLRDIAKSKAFSI